VKFSKKNRNEFFSPVAVKHRSKKGDVKRWMSADEVGNTTADHVPSPFDLRVLKPSIGEFIETVLNLKK